MKRCSIKSAGRVATSRSLRRHHTIRQPVSAPRTFESARTTRLKQVSMQIQPTTVTDRDLWNATLAQIPTAHILQTWEWGEFKKSTTGWTPQRFAYMRKGGVVAMAQVLTRQVGPFKIMYVPKGPALDYSDPALRTAVIGALQRYARDKGAIFIKMDPDVVMGTGVP